MTRKQRRFLIINPFGIGDVLFSVPLAACIKKVYPDAAVGFLVNSRAAAALRNNPCVDAVHLYDRDASEEIRKRSFWAWCQESLQRIGELRAKEYDVAIDCSLNRQYGLWAMLSCIRERVGYDYKGRGTFLTKSLRLAGYDDAHAVEYYLRLLELVGIPHADETYQLFLDADERRFAGQMLAPFGGKRLVALAPGGGESWGKDAHRKQWPTEHWLSLAKMFLAQPNTVLIVAAAPKEEATAERIAALDADRIITTRGCSLRQFMAIVARCDVAVCNDGGPLHIAAALGVRTVGIFGPVDERVYGARPADRRDAQNCTNPLLCRPCYRRFRVRSCGNNLCLGALAPKQVFDATAAVLRGEEPVCRALKGIVARPRRRWLIINPFGIGDVVFSTPVIARIKRENPADEIYFLCNARTEGIVAADPYVTGVISYDRDVYAALKSRSFFAWAKAYHGLAERIRSLRIDVAIDLSMNRLYAGLCLWAGVRLRAGLDYRGRGLFLNRKIAIAGFESKHVSEYYADVLRLAGISIDIADFHVRYPFAASQKADAFVRERIAREGASIVGIAPLGGQTFGANAGVKHWPQEHFVRLIERLVEDKGRDVILFGSAAECDALEMMRTAAVRAGTRVQVFCGGTIVEAAALIDRCDVFVANDTGLLRIADALGKKCVAILGPVDDAVYGLYPYDVARHRMLCTRPPCWPCYKRFRLASCDRAHACIRGVTVDDAMRALEELGV